MPVVAIEVLLVALAAFAGLEGDAMEGLIGVRVPMPERDLRIPQGIVGLD